MSEIKTFTDAETNTDPLTVQIYIDDEGRIKGNIIMEETKEILQKQQTNALYIPSIVSEVFKNIYIINARNNYNFLYEKVPLIISSETSKKITTNFTNYDYSKNLNGITRENIWNNYMQTSTIDYNYLTTAEISYINAFSTIILTAKQKNLDEVFIIIDDHTLNLTTVSEYQSIQNTFEIENAKIILSSYKVNNNLLTKITSLILRKDLYDKLLTKLHTKEMTIFMCLVNLIHENYFLVHKLESQFM